MAHDELANSQKKTIQKPLEISGMPEKVPDIVHFSNLVGLVLSGMLLFPGNIDAVYFYTGVFNSGLYWKIGSYIGRNIICVRSASHVVCQANDGSDSGE
uniref:Uncharacterized protein n=1 Tax=Strigamia maritima TaxID=126957 RepID=T1J053_STRMM